ncbi:hypothetical protein DFH08DRAFT_1012624 [Mycena albidolilacea]|uniref:Uncharacterized protein n=1 Tax=Mycena albidolilacea TaxID=1033008 RepID=A0AAD6ZUN9_9AGAR|nr:hypothetical protein DFH08DRAFT_1012624 [Mycena albidolilacea]
MGNETHVNEDFNSGSTIENLGPTCYGAFSGSQHFTVAGGTFTNTTTTNNYHTPPTVPSDFRWISMGEIDLQREIRWDKHSGVVEYRRERRSVRRVYSAKVDRGKLSVTVATYQGDSAEEDVEFQAVQSYFASTFQHWVSDGECTFLIRRSTGRICVDLAPGNFWFYSSYPLDQRSNQPEFKSLNTPSLEAAAFDSLTLEEYHEICYWQFSQRRYVSVYNPITFNLGTVISCPLGNRLEDLVEIAFLSRTDSGPNRPPWDTVDWGVVMENVWTRLSASDAVATIYTSLNVGYLDSDYWLSQANHIFKHLGISSNFEDYVLLEHVAFFLSILPSSTAAPLEGFLFLCPPTDFQIGPSSFKWPERPAYWSLDPFGTDPLSWEDAANLGFPSLQLFTRIRGRSWDAGFTLDCGSSIRLEASIQKVRMSPGILGSHCWNCLVI